MEEPTKKVKKHKANITQECSDSGDNIVRSTLKDKKKTKKKDESSDQVESGVVPSEELNSKPRDEKKSRKAREGDEENNEENALKKVSKKQNEMDRDVEVSVIREADDKKRTKKKKNKKKKDNTCDYIESGVTHRDDLTTGEEVKSKKLREHKEENSEEVVAEKVKKKRKKSDIDIEEIPTGVEDDKKDKKKKKKKVMSPVQDGLENTIDENNNGHKRKNRDESVRDGYQEKSNEEGSDAQVWSNSEKPKSSKKVRFAADVEIFPTTADDGMIHGKRFTRKEDKLIKKAIRKYIKVHKLGEDGLHKVLNSTKFPEAKGCWKEIALSLPWRPKDAINNRAHRVLERGEEPGWTLEDYETMRKYYEIHGPKWKKLADEMGRHRIHVKDAFRRVKFRGNVAKGHRSKKITQDEYRKLFDLVNMDLQSKSQEEKKSKHGMLKDNIPWGAIADNLATRSHTTYCEIWYSQLSSPMVEDGKWADSDDYRMIGELYRLDECCMEDVDWDNLVKNRRGDICRKRWSQMVKHIGGYKKRTFAEQVEELSKRYCPSLLEAREEFENRPYDDLAKQKR